jgi:hypothetical protein
LFGLAKEGEADSSSKTTANPARFMV